MVSPVQVLDEAHPKAIEAAYQLAHSIEDLLATERIQQCSLHIVPALFAATSIFARLVQVDHRIFQRLAHVKYKVCMVALEELREQFPICQRILSAFAEGVPNLHAKD